MRYVAPQYNLPFISVLCVQPGSNYEVLRQLGRVDTWDESRDAWNFRGPGPVIAHPPCRLWGNLSQFVRASDAVCTREIALGLWCGLCVQQYGGVLEQPRGSKLWKALNLPRPGQKDRHGFTMQFPQNWFNHSSIKESWFYFVGLQPGDLPVMPYKFLPNVGGGNGAPGSVVRQGHKERNATPFSLCLWLVEVCERISAGASGASLAATKQCAVESK